MKHLTSELVLKLIDQLSGPAAKSSAALAKLSAADKHLQDQLKKVQGSEKQLDAFKRLQKQLISTSEQVDHTEQRYRRLSAQMAAAEKPTKKLIEQTTRAEKAAISARLAFQKQATAVEDSKKAYEHLAGPLHTVASAQQRARSETDRLTYSLERNRRAIEDVEKAEQRAATIRSRRRDAMATIASGVGLVAAEKGREVLRKVVETYREYDDLIRYQTAVADLNPYEVKSRQAQALRLGGSTSFNDLQVLEAQLSLSQRGVKKALIEKMVEETVPYAQAMNISLPQAAKTLENVIFSTGQSVEDAATAQKIVRRNVNLLTYGAKHSGFSAEEEAEAFKFGAPTASGAGMSTETLLALLGTMKRVGFQGSETGVAARAIATHLISPTRQGMAALDAMGIKFSNYTKTPDAGLSPTNLSNTLKRSLGHGIAPRDMAKLEEIMSDEDVVSNQDEFISKVVGVLRRGYRKRGGRHGAQDDKALTKVVSDFYKMSLEGVDIQGLLLAILKAHPTMGQANALVSDKHGGKLFKIADSMNVFVEMLEGLKNVPDDYTTKIGDLRMGGFSGAMKKLEGSLLNAYTSIGRAFGEGESKLPMWNMMWEGSSPEKAGALTNFVKTLAHLAQGFAELDPHVIRFVSTAAALAATAGGLYGSFKILNALLGKGGLGASTLAVERFTAALNLASGRLGAGTAAGALGVAEGSVAGAGLMAGLRQGAMKAIGLAVKGGIWGSIVWAVADALGIPELVGKGITAPRSRESLESALENQRARRARLKSGDEYVPPGMSREESIGQADARIAELEKQLKALPSKPLTWADVWPSKPPSNIQVPANPFNTPQPGTGFGNLVHKASYTGDSDGGAIRVGVYQGLQDYFGLRTGGANATGPAGTVSGMGGLVSDASYRAGDAGGGGSGGGGSGGSGGGGGVGGGGGDGGGGGSGGTSRGRRRGGGRASGGGGDTPSEPAAPAPDPSSPAGLDAEERAATKAAADKSLPQWNRMWPGSSPFAKYLPKSAGGEGVPIPGAGKVAGGGGNVPPTSSLTTYGKGTTRPEFQRGVYDAFRRAGLSHLAAKSFTAEIGRENEFQARYLFGTHSDPANHVENAGMMSWQGSRNTALRRYLRSQGVLNPDGTIQHTQAALDAQARFAMNEMRDGTLGPRGRRALGVLMDPNSTHAQQALTLGDDVIKWAQHSALYGPDGVRRRERAFREVSGLTDNSPAAGAARAASAAAGAPTAFHPDAVFGDSIGHGVLEFSGRGKFAGTARDSMKPAWILKQIQAYQGDLRGKNVVLSSGYSNDPGNLAGVEAEMQALQARGAHVTLLGVGPHFGPEANEGLRALANKYGAGFTPLTKTGRDGVHPRSYAEQLRAIEASGGPPEAAPPPTAQAPAIQHDPATPPHAHWISDLHNTIDQMSAIIQQRKHELTAPVNFRTHHDGRPAPVTAQAHLRRSFWSGGTQTT